MIDGWGISNKVTIRWMSLDFTKDKSTLVQVMAWCRQATSHYLSQFWPRSLSPYGIIRPQWVKPPLKFKHERIISSHMKVWYMITYTCLIHRKTMVMERSWCPNITFLPSLLNHHQTNCRLSVVCLYSVPAFDVLLQGSMCYLKADFWGDQQLDTRVACCWFIASHKLVG